MKVKDVVALKIGVPAANIIIYRVGGWLQDEINGVQLYPVGHPNRPANALDFSPDVPETPMSYYAEISIKLGDEPGQRFTVEFRPTDLI